ncbi:copper amine oxidase N-terminal domain-containing protein [Paenibacillus xylanexedens]|uniref:stalk domain-containing protein n=1 Tax=Paenibacillus xylanexedens TaxID=528191 RepID=UPI001F15D317|nr:stalk domain-containing protein [Paenibacillus xylanexedens]MCF7756255.1 copper amine oxidase N-terminal domain-containing protein [Paenibacillus xylanexedens]
MKKKVVLGLMVGTLTLGIGTGALAATGLEQIKAYLNSKITLKMNGATVTAKDANGKTVLPITYNGTTYLPVRAVGSLLGTEITYDSATSSVLIGGKSETGPVTNDKVTLSTLGTTVLGSTAWHTKDPAETTYKGKDYKDVYLHTDSVKQGDDFQIMTDKKYSSLHLELAALQGNQEIQVINQDNTVLKKLSISPGSGLVSLDVDVSGTEAVFVEIVSEDPGSSLFVPLTTSYLVK